MLCLLKVSLQALIVDIGEGAVLLRPCVRSWESHSPLEISSASSTRRNPNWWQVCASACQL